jgi:integrase
MKLQDVMTVYKKSVDWGVLRPNSKRNYLQAFNHLKPIIMKDIADIRRRDVLKIRDGLMDRPGTANVFVTAASRLLTFAVDREYIDVNVALNIRRLKLGEYRAWKDSELKAFLAVAEGYVRTAFLIALYTGQRYSDVFSMRWTDYDGLTIKVRQEKTGAPLIIPCHKNLKVELDSLPKNGMWIMSSDGINKYVKSTFRDHWIKALKKADLRGVGCVFHGLRKTAAKKLAEAGASTHEIMAITGHKTVAMVQKYTDAAEQERRAKNAIDKLTIMEDMDDDDG